MNVQFLAESVALAAFYAIVGAGFVLIYRSSRIVNLAHGDLMMLGGYLAFAFVPLFPPALAWGGLLLALIGSFVLGYALYFLIMRPLIGQPVVAALMVTIGVSSMLEGLATLIWTPQTQLLAVTLNIANDPHRLWSGVVLSTYDLATIVCAVIYVGAIIVFLKFSRVGVQMRAAAENPILASQRGINVFSIFALTWSIAILGATMAGVLFGGNNRLAPDIGVVGLTAMTVPLVGGMDSMWGLIPASLMVALAEHAVSTYIDPALSDIIPMAIMLLVLIARPWGLFGTKEEIQRV